MKTETRTNEQVENAGAGISPMPPYSVDDLETMRALYPEYFASLSSSTPLNQYS